MLILLIVTLAAFLPSSVVMVVINNTAALDTIDQQRATLTLQLKMDHMLGKLESALKNIEEKANAWAIFKHNIDAWNEQIRVVEEKLDLIKRSQDEQQHKLSALEFTQNHVLSKVVFLSEGCATKLNNCQGDDAGTTDRALDESYNLNKRKLNEIIAYLNSLLHQTGNGNAKTSGGNHTASEGKGKRGNANIVMPVGCNAAKKPISNQQQLEPLLKQLQRKFNAFTSAQPTKREFRQIQEMAKKNGNSLDALKTQLQEVIDLHGINANHWDRMYAHCSSVKSELTTFTTSSDLLLKLLEKLIKSVHKDLKNIYNGTDNDKVPHVQADSTITDYENEGETEAEYTSVTNIEDNDDEVEVIDFNSDGDGCHELPVDERVDGIYNFGDSALNNASRDFNERYCVFATSGAAWTLIQNRNSYIEQENFNRSWHEYATGFGNLHKEFWFGNEYIHQITQTDVYELRIELEDFENTRVWAEYTNFRLDNELANYRLLINGYHGIVGDALTYHNLKQFSTYDRRNDPSAETCCSCAITYGSGWWFDKCFESNLNGIYHDTPFDHNNVGIVWEHWHGDYSLKSARMLIRPRRYGE